MRQGSLETVKLLLTVGTIDINVESFPAEDTQSKLIQNYQRNAHSGATLNYQIGDDSQSSAEKSVLMQHSSTGVPTKKSQRSKTLVQGSRQEDAVRSETNVTSVKLGSNLCVYENPDTGRFDFQMKNAGESVGKNFDELSITPLAEACACFHDIEIMELLLLHGARDDNGLACRIAHLIERSDLIKLILSYRTVMKEDQPVCEGRKNQLEPPEASAL